MSTSQQEDQYEQAQAQHRAAASRAYYDGLLRHVQTALTWFTEPAHRSPVRQFMGLEPFLPRPDEHAGDEEEKAYRLNQGNLETVQDADRQLREVAHSGTNLARPTPCDKPPDCGGEQTPIFCRLRSSGRKLCTALWLAPDDAPAHSLGTES
ncbi:hypothetical protein BMF94_4894 [Rhodotorula taiwanensis]|uniref:Uncharacterized protein n=1 Tax=Rhodotorula taiwanensis TaxID=741276 RepID=A0A2S5B5N9_9BASI|nr:hypothetical protein BMF94_4894 [Rhodotorula taiwanensis]